MSEVFPRFNRSASLFKLSKSRIDLQFSEQVPYGNLSSRHKDDVQHMTTSEMSIGEVPRKKFIPAISREPSYTKFKVPFQMICQKRFSQKSKEYEQQFCSEINKIINNQATAREATYFVRIVSYTTLWPPYHNERELNETSRRFYKLTPKEQARFDHIMTHDFSYI